MALFKLTYRDKFMAREVFVDASSFEKAQEVGRAWVDRESSFTDPRRFVKVEPAVVADESILEPKPDA